MGSGAILGAPFVLTRRGAAWGMGLSQPPLAIAYSAAASDITIVPDTNNLVVESFTVAMPHIQNMVDSVVKSLSGKSTVAEAWESLFPAGQLSSSTKVAIKINHSYGGDDSYNDQWMDKFCPVGPKAAVSDAVINGLTQMLGGTFPVENVTIYDKDALGPWMSNPKMAVQGYPAHDRSIRYYIEEPGGPRILLFDPAETPPQDAPQFSCGVTGNMVTQTIVPALYEADFTVNISIPKVHQAGGITGTMKNTYGATYDCFTTHGNGPGDGAPGVTPCLPEFYRSQHGTTPCILDIMDAIGLMYDGSGAHHGSVTTPNIIAASHDPVMLDCHLLELVNEARRANGLHDILLSTSTEHLATPQWIWPGGCNVDGYINAAHLVVASEPPFSLGITDTSVRSYLDITGARSTHVPTADNAQSRVLALRQSAGGWQLSVRTDNSGRMHTVEGRIRDLNGRAVREFSTQRTLASDICLYWDGRSGSGSSVARGVYSWEVRVDGRRYAQTVRAR